MKELLKTSNWISGLQWLFFMFTNIVVIPITIGAAFQLPQSTVVMLIQLSFVVTGLACMAQAFLGHGRAIMEGQSGLWWGVILTIAISASAQGIPLETVGGSLAVGIVISGVLTVIIGLSGLGHSLSKLFNPGVMGVFIFLLGCNLIGIFFQGMLGIPFGHQSESAHIDVSISLLSIMVVIVVIVISIKARPSIRRYALLIGIMVGWLLFTLVFEQNESIGEMNAFQLELFPLGTPDWHIGIIATAVLTGLLNAANTFGALKGTDHMYHAQTTKSQYRSSFTITGLFTGLAGLFGLVPYASYVSSIGFLSQTGILNRLPFILGGFMFVIMGIIPVVGYFFSLLPLSIGSAVLFVAYLQLLLSSWNFFKTIGWNEVNVYRTAIPLFVGIVLMTFPASYFQSIPEVVRPLLSNGMLMGIILALVLESLFAWDRYGVNQKGKPLQRESIQD